MLPAACQNTMTFAPHRVSTFTFHRVSTFIPLHRVSTPIPHCVSTFISHCALQPDSAHPNTASHSITTTPCFTTASSFVFYFVRIVLPS